MNKFHLASILAITLAATLPAADEQPKQQKQAALPAGKAPSDPAAHAAGAPVDVKTYIIGAEDVLLITVWDSAQLSRQVTVRPDGKISIPLLNETQAAGLTPEKLGENITEGLLKYMTHPDVSVAVQAVNSKKYFIMGEVQRTGAFPLLVPTTVLEALVNAGGFRDFAKKSGILIIRGAQRFKFNYNEVIKGKHREENILLEPGDQIIVP